MEDRIIRKIKFYNIYEQCSYNCYAMILDYFFGTPNIVPDNSEFKQALPKRLAGFYGWSPYFYYIVKEGKLNWNKSNLRDLKIEMFSIDSKNIPKVNDYEVQIQIEESELLEINKKILEKLEIGNWTVDFLGSNCCRF